MKTSKKTATAATPEAQGIITTPALWVDTDAPGAAVVPTAPHTSKTGFQSPSPRNNDEAFDLFCATATSRMTRLNAQKGHHA